jgi:hypothetical protein
MYMLYNHDICLYMSTQRIRWIHGDYIEYFCVVNHLKMAAKRGRNMQCEKCTINLALKYTVLRTEVFQYLIDTRATGCITQLLWYNINKNII